MITKLGHDALHKNYDPMNSDNIYLDNSKINRAYSTALKGLGNNPSKSDIEALNYAKKYEKERTKTISRNKDVHSVVDKYDNLNLNFRDKHQDWAHHMPGYHKFYDSIDSLIGKNNK